MYPKGYRKPTLLPYLPLLISYFNVQRWILINDHISFDLQLLSDYSDIHLHIVKFTYTSCTDKLAWYAYFYLILLSSLSAYFV